MERPMSKEVHSRGSSSAWVLASTPLGLGVVVVGLGRAWPSLAIRSLPSSVTAAFLRVEAGGEEPGGGLGTAAGASQRLEELDGPPA
jgi:hypothetical protein